MHWNTEYPRPQMRRNSCMILNEGWKLNGRDICLPFPPQGRLSGYEGEIGDELEYDCVFALPEGFARPGEHIRLHFGAVDQIAQVYVNDCMVIHHEGGYLPFFADITYALKAGENRLRVKAIDALNHDYPYGKQKKDRGGMWYTPVSGIWQTVWLEAVPINPIECLRIQPDLSGVTLTVLTGAAWCEAEIEGKIHRIETNRPVRIEIPNPRLWSPESPHLYDLILRSENDTVYSYFALRIVEISGNRILLNGRPIFLSGVLDQGYYPDGIYLPETPEEYQRDILRMKQLGFNLLRKHCKVEPEAFYYACDRLGMLVMQDMVNSGSYNFMRDTALPTVGFKRRRDDRPNPRDQFRRDFFTEHALQTQMHLYNHPCVIAYTIFNEGWGQFESGAHYDLLKAADPSRIYDSASGWFHPPKSDVDSEHVYFRNKKLKCGQKPMLLSECGGFSYPVEGHLFNPGRQYGYSKAAKDAFQFTAQIENMWEKMVLPAIPQGLCGAILTQLSDIEDEINGLYTYDRQICKVVPERIHSLCKRAGELVK